MKNFFSSDDHHIGMITGVVGGMGKFIFIGIHAAFFIKLLEAGVTAFACGILGAAGKISADFLKEWYQRYKDRKNNQA